MEGILDEVVSSEELKKFESIYNKQIETNSVTTEAQFTYAWCLVRSRYAADIRKGICLLEVLFNGDDPEAKRDYIYYLALGNAKLKNYKKALQYCRAFLNLEPENQQVQNLETLIKKRMEKEGMVGMALAGGVALAIGGLVSLGIAMSSRK